jgi:hypothetical protein
LLGAVILIGLASVAGPAKAACTVPNTLTNGQIADASQVMGNFGAVANCADAAVTPSGSPANGNIAIFTGPKTVTGGDLTGDCSTSGTSLVTCNKASSSQFGVAKVDGTTITATGGVISAIGAGGRGYLTLSIPLAPNFATSSNAAIGNVLRPVSSGTLIGVGAVGSLTTGNTYEFGFAAYDESTNKLLASPVYTSSFTAPLNGNRAFFAYFSSPLSFSAYNSYLVFLVRTDSTTTVSQSLAVASGAVTSPAIWIDAATADTARVLASTSPTTMDTWTAPSQFAWGLSLVYTIN